MGTVVKSIRMQKSLALNIKALADKENRNFSNMVETLLLEKLNGQYVAVYDITEIDKRPNHGCP